jgi:hypothetical protein
MGEMSLRRPDGADPAESRPVRVAAVGCGYWRKNLVREFAELGALAAICDPDRAAVLALAEGYRARVADFDAVARAGRPDKRLGAIHGSPAWPVGPRRGGRDAESIGHTDRGLLRQAAPPTVGL